MLWYLGAAHWVIRSKLLNHVLKIEPQWELAVSTSPGRTRPPRLENVGSTTESNCEHRLGLKNIVQQRGVVREFTTLSYWNLPP